MASPAPQKPPVSLIVHDGELADVAELMRKQGLVFTERCGEVAAGDHTTQWDLLIGTPKRVLEFHPEEAKSKLTRMAIFEQGSKTLRSMLQRAQIELLVARPVHPTALRLLLLHTLYRGPERRMAQRVSVGGEVRFRVGLRRRSGVLADISNCGCRLLSEHPLEKGQKLSVAIPAELAAGKAFSVDGRVLRSIASDRPGVLDAAVSFINRSASVNASLRATVAAHTSGPAALSSHASANGAALKTAAPAAATPCPMDRCESPRAGYERRVVAHDAEAARALMGRDISLGGMSVAPHPGLSIGDQLQVGLHLRGRDKPLVVDARVARDDGERGLVLRFYRISESAKTYIRGMMDYAPATTNTNGQDADVIVSEIIEHTRLAP